MNRKSLLLGIDLGTTNVKAIFIDETGNYICSASRELTIDNPKPNWVEQDSNQWWQKTCECIKEITEKPEVGSDKIACIAASGQGCGALPLDSSGKAIYSAIIWMDFRAEKECKQFGKHQDEIFKISGNTLDPVQNVASILWLKNNRPETYKKTSKFLTATAFLNYMLTDNFIENDSDAGLSVLYDMHKKNWSKELADLYDISLNKMPEIRKCTDLVGSINKELAEITGLMEGTPVCAGGEDTSSAALAMGIYKNGQVGLSTGTSTNLVLCIDKNIALKNSLNMPHVIDGFRFVSGNIPTSGICMDWFKNLFNNIENDNSIIKLNKNFLRYLDKEAEKAPPGSGNIIFLPYLAGSAYPISNPEARGVFFGLSLSTNRSHISRAILEGVAFSYRSIIDYLCENEFTVSEMYATGGPTKSEIWNQISSDVCNIPIFLLDTIAEATVGDAMIAGVACGIFKDFKEAIQKTVKIGKKYYPNIENKKIYSKLYKIEMDLFKTLFPIYVEVLKT